MIAKLLPNRVRRSYLGGSRIDAFCNIPSTFQPPRDAAQPRPEDWLASTTQAFNGTLEIEGEGLGCLEDGRLVRDAVGALPILVKLLDSDERLVVQAHPTVPCAKRLFHSPVGKTECWHFLPGTAPDACVYLGFKPGITRAAWEQAVRECSQISNEQLPIVNNPVLNLLHRIPVAPGDFVFVDGGVPHAIGGGCFMVELQEPSDLMVVAERFTPSGRRIPDAKMHGGVGWERMFDVYEYDGHTYEETCARYVLKCSQFSNAHKSSLFTNGANANVNFEAAKNTKEHKDFVNSVDFVTKNNPCGSAAPREAATSRPCGTGGKITFEATENTKEHKAFVNSVDFVAKNNPCGSAAPRDAATRICGPEFTDKFEMWRLTSGGNVALGGKPAVIVVTAGDGSLNGLPAKRGDRLVASGERALAATGALSCVVCF